MLRPAVLAVLGMLIALPALAQQHSTGTAGPGTPGPAVLPAGSVGATATGSAPIRAASTTAVGKTKPPGSPVGEGLGTRPDLEEKTRRLSKKIRTGICVGCR